MLKLFNIQPLGIVGLVNVLFNSFTNQPLKTIEQLSSMTMLAYYKCSFIHRLQPDIDNDRY